MSRLFKIVGRILVAAYVLAVFVSFVWAMFWGGGEASLAMIVPLIVALPFVFIFSWVFHGAFGEYALVFGVLLQAALFGYCAV